MADEKQKYKSSCFELAKSYQQKVEKETVELEKERDFYLSYLARPEEKNK